MERTIHTFSYLDFADDVALHAELRLRRWYQKPHLLTRDELAEDKSPSFGQPGG